MHSRSRRPFYRSAQQFIDSTARCRRASGHHRLLRCEPLEDRRMLSGAPVAVDDLVLATINTPLTIDYLTLNDTDPDGDLLSVQSAADPLHGSLVDNGNGSFTYTPHTGFLGQDNFTYVVTDNMDGTDTGSVAIIVSDVLDVAAARSQILSGVSTLFDPGSAGRIAAFGPQAAVIGNDQEDGAIIAAATWGQGRVIAMNDHQWLAMEREVGTGTDTAQYYENSIAWLAGTTDKNIKIVTYSSGNSDNRDWLIDHGYTHVVSASSGDLPFQLFGAEVFVPSWLGSNVSSDVLDTIADFTRNGGGLFIADFGTGYRWWWNKNVYDAPGNILLREAGIGFPDDTSARLNVSPATGHIDADVVWNMLDDSSGFTQSQLEEGSRLLDFMFDVMPPGDSLLARLEERFWDRIDSINPTPATPVDDPFDIALLNREAQILRDIPATEVTAHRTAEAVYGVIPADAPRVTQQVTLDTTHGRWHATGLYAAPGEVVTITVPSSLVNQDYRIRINAHTDTVGRSTLERSPYVHRSYEITSTTMQVANAFGGSIFVDFGGDCYSEPPGLGDINITISGAVEQPYFVLGEHTDQEWIDMLRGRPAPYAVFVSDNLMFTQRSSESVLLDEPTALMTWWDEVVRLEDQIANRLEERTAPEFINVDVQQSAGSAHSGYPIQAYDKYWGNLADYNYLIVNGSWGNFHELGHNHQRNWWKFDGDGEVTVNVFSTYALRNQASNPTTGWWWTTDPAEVMHRALTAVGTSSTYSGISDVGDRLAFWVQLADGFGWETYENVLGDYEFDNANHPSNLPVTNQEKKDQWLVRWSNEVGYNMEMFMVDTWGLYVSQSAIDEVSALPDWMPLATSMSVIDARINTPLVLDITGAGLSMDGVATLVNVGQPTSGTLSDNGNGTYTYMPLNGFAGNDSYTTTYRSSVGNQQTFTTTVRVSDGVVASWQMDEGQGGTVSDSGPVGATGTIQGAQWTTDQFGGSALQFDGVDDRVTFGSTPALAGKTDFSVSAWIRTTGSGVIIQQRNGGFNGEYQLSVNGDGTLKFFLYGNSAYQFNFSTIQTVNDGQWHHVIAQRQGSTGRILIDGQLAESATGTIRDLNATIEVAIGADIRSNSKHFAGTIDDVRIYDYAIAVSLADFDTDGDVDGEDLDLWEGGFGTTTGANMVDGDADGDGDVDGMDFLIWQQNVGSTASSGSAAAGSAASEATGTGSGASLSTADPSTNASNGSSALPIGPAFTRGNGQDTPTPPANHRGLSFESVDLAVWLLPQPKPKTNGNTTAWLDLSQFQFRNAAQSFQRDQAVDAVMSRLDGQALRTDLEHMHYRIRDITLMNLTTSRDEMGMAFRAGKKSIREITSPAKTVEDRSDLETALEELTIEPVFKSRGLIRV